MAKSRRQPDEVTVVLDATIWRRIARGCKRFCMNGRLPENLLRVNQAGHWLAHHVGSQSGSIGIELTMERWGIIASGCLHARESAGRFLVEAISGQVWAHIE